MAGSRKFEEVAGQEDVFNWRPPLSAVLLVTSILFILVAIGGGVLIKNYSVVHDDARWFLWSQDYKAKVLAQEGSSNGEFKHIEWDGWGFPGAGDTTIFLVYDPKDSLWVAARGHQPGKFDSIPCEVPLVHRLESQWYTVRFYTEEYWGKRNALDCGLESQQ
jgi:hypothetical protein